MVLHDRSLCQELALIESVCRATHLALDNLRLHAKLKKQLRELHDSRARIVHAGDEARRRLERDLHDGAQQRLLALGLALQLLHHKLDNDDPQTVALLDDTRGHLQSALAELRELARGIHPAVLTNGGLEAALRQLADRATLPVRLVVHDPLPSLPEAVAATAYFIASEALANIAKHANATRAAIDVRYPDDTLELQISDNGSGGATTGPGITGLIDRVNAINGSLRFTSSPTHGTTLTATIPMPSPR